MRSSAKLLSGTATLFMGFLVLGMHAACGPAPINNVYTGLDGTGDRRRTKFYTDTKTIYCNADFSGTLKDMTVTMKIFASRIEDPFSGAKDYGTRGFLVAVGEEAPGDTSGTVAFQLVKIDPVSLEQNEDLPYLVGSFECVMYANGVEQGSAPFEVAYPDPDCPVALLIPGSQCIGYHRVGAKCTPQDQKASCECLASGIWGGAECH